MVRHGACWGEEEEEEEGFFILAKIFQLLFIFFAILLYLSRTDLGGGAAVPAWSGGVQYDRFVITSLVLAILRRCRLPSGPPTQRGSGWLAPHRPSDLETDKANGGTTSEAAGTIAHGSTCGRVEIFSASSPFRGLFFFFLFFFASVSRREDGS
jgi:hypothetical protein